MSIQIFKQESNCSTFINAASPPASDDKDPKVFIREFLATYASLPCLWDVNSKEYKDRWKKSKSYEVLVAKYKERYPNAVREDVTKRLNSLRTNYRKEKRRIKELQAANGSQHVQPNLFYFDDMKFLEDMEVSSSHPEHTRREHEDSTTLEIPSYISPPQSAPPRTKRRQQAPPTPSKCSWEEDLTQAQVWASELSKMSSEQRIHATKAINDIIYEGRLGNLSHNCVRIEPPPTATRFRDGRHHVVTVKQESADEYDDEMEDRLVLEVDG